MLGDTDYGYFIYYSIWDAYKTMLQPPICHSVIRLIIRTPYLRNKNDEKYFRI